MKKAYLLIIMVALLVIAFAISKKNMKRVPKSENPYKYELNGLDKTNAEDVCYTESDSIIPDLELPKSIAIDQNDNIFTLGDHQLLGFDKDKNPILNIALNSKAHSLGVSADNLYYIGFDRHIEVYNKEGERIAKWDSLPKPSMFSSIAISPNYVYVSDAGKAVLHKYDKDGNYQFAIAKKDTTKGIRGCVLPSRYFDVVFNGGQIWLVNSGRHSVENYTENGDLRSYWGISSMKAEGFCGCCNPSNIAVLPNGYFVTSEKGIPRIKIYDSAGNYKCMVAGSENFTHGSYGRDIAVNSKAEVFVLDSPHNKIRIFKPLQDD